VNGQGTATGWPSNGPHTARGSPRYGQGMATCRIIALRCRCSSGGRAVVLLSSVLVSRGGSRSPGGGWFSPVGCAAEPLTQRAISTRSQTNRHSTRHTPTNHNIRRRHRRKNATAACSSMKKRFPGAETRTPRRTIWSKTQDRRSPTPSSVTACSGSIAPASLKRLTNRFRRIAMMAATLILAAPA
jgi:hypothetical protein